MVVARLGGGTGPELRCRKMYKKNSSISLVKESKAVANSKLKELAGNHKSSNGIMTNVNGWFFIQDGERFKRGYSRTAYTYAYRVLASIKILNLIQYLTLSNRCSEMI